MHRVKLQDEEESDLDVKGGEEDNDSDTNPFSPEKTNPPRETSNEEEIKIGNLSNKFSPTAPTQPIEALELQMSSPTSVVTRASAQKAQIKIEKTVVVDVIVEEVDVKREKRRAQAGGSFKSEEREQLPPPSDFCRLCYCRFNFFSLQILKSFSL